MWLVGLASVVGSSSHPFGPGAGPWETATPESQGLSSEALHAAEEATASAMGGRVCYVVIKNGRLVYERYRGAGSETRTQSSFSATKSMCASLAGIAVEQGWLSTEDLVANRTANTLLCSAQAAVKHVLTMSGTSPNLPDDPRYSYDTLGISCLNTIQNIVRG